MTAFAPPVTIDGSRTIAPQTVPRNLLTSGSYFASAPWQYNVFSELHKLEKATTRPKNLCELQVDQSAVMFARTVLADLHELNVPSPVVCPISGGGVGMVWSVGTKQLEVAFAADQTGSFVLSAGDEVIGDGELSRNATSELERALRSVIGA